MHYSLLPDSIFFFFISRQGYQQYFQNKFQTVTPLKYILYVTSFYVLYDYLYIKKKDIIRRLLTIYVYTCCVVCCIVHCVWYVTMIWTIKPNIKFLEWLNHTTHYYAHTNINIYTSKHLYMKWMCNKNKR